MPKIFAEKTFRTEKAEQSGVVQSGLLGPNPTGLIGMSFFYYSCIDYAGKNECKMLQYRLKLLIGQQKCLYICYRYLLVQLQKLRRKLQI